MTESVQYGWLPPEQQVASSQTSNLTVPAGYIHQTAWNEEGGADIQGVYAHPTESGWQSMVWRWADTMRSDSIQHVTLPEGTPAYRVEISKDDDASHGTEGNSPRAEFISVGPEELWRRSEPPAAGFLRDGEEYWATFAVYIPAEFPTNHQWATLFQRKFDHVESQKDPQGNYNYLSWFTINVHGNYLDVTIPGHKDYVEPKRIATLEPEPTNDELPSVVDRWTQFVIHEKLSSAQKGLAEIFVNGTHVPVRPSELGAPKESTVRAGDINFHFQYGYYRSNDAQEGGAAEVDLGVLYYTPLLIKRGASQLDEAPALP